MLNDGGGLVVMSLCAGISLSGIYKIAVTRRYSPKCFSWIVDPDIMTPVLLKSEPTWPPYIATSSWHPELPTCSWVASQSLMTENCCWRLSADSWVDVFHLCTKVSHCSYWLLQWWNFLQHQSDVYMFNPTVHLSAPKKSFDTPGRRWPSEVVKALVV